MLKKGELTTVSTIVLATLLIFSAIFSVYTELETQKLNDKMISQEITGLTHGGGSNNPPVFGHPLYFGKGEDGEFHATADTSIDTSFRETGFNYTYFIVDPNVKSQYAALFLLLQEFREMHQFLDY